MSDVSGVCDVVRHALTGMVVPPASIPAIAEAVGMLLDHPDYAHRLGDAGRTDVRQTLDIRRVVRRYEECYDAVRAVGHAA
jgi:glycosyltransferase involved in cell wall biosynthesis